MSQQVKYQFGLTQKMFYTKSSGDNHKETIRNSCFCYFVKPIFLKYLHVINKMRNKSTFL